jgi:hypothetical protein
MRSKWKRMKRIISWLFILTFTFALGVSATFLYIKFNNSFVQKTEILNDAVSTSKENDSQALPILAYCELANNPEKYNGKIIRVSSTLSFGDHGSYFSDANCRLPENGAIIWYKTEEVQVTISQAREQKDKKFLAHELNVITVGRFSNKVYKDPSLIVQFQFEILKVEKASITS